MHKFQRHKKWDLHRKELSGVSRTSDKNSLVAVEWDLSGWLFRLVTFLSLFGGLSVILFHLLGKFLNGCFSVWGGFVRAFFGLDLILIGGSFVGLESFVQVSGLWSCGLLFWLFGLSRCLVILDILLYQSLFVLVTWLRLRLFFNLFLGEISQISNRLVRRLSSFFGFLFQKLEEDFLLQEAVVRLFGLPNTALDARTDLRLCLHEIDS